MEPNEKRKRGRGEQLSPTHREELIYEVAKMDRQGYSNREIADRHGISNCTVHSYLKIVRERYKERVRLDRDVLVEEKWAQFDDLAHEAWLVYEKTKQPSVKFSEEKALRSKFSKIDKHQGRQAIPSYWFACWDWM